MSYRRRGAYAPAGPRLDAAAPNSLPLTTVPPFDVVYSGEFDPEGAYEASIVSAGGQWTVTPSPTTGEGSAVVQDETTLVATFAVPPDADDPGLGYTQVKDLATGEFGPAVPFTWTAARKAGPRKRQAAPDE